MKNYWENEPDIEVDTGRNVLRYYREAGKLQVSMPYWTNDAGEEKQGKTVTLNLAAMSGNAEAGRLLETVLADVANK